MRRRLVAAVVLALGLVAVAAPVRAGGWVSVTLDTPLSQVRAGEVQHIGFMVKQHGVTPIHQLGSEPLQTVLTARHQQSDQRLRVEGYPDGAVGHFSMDVTFPTDGTWLVEITPGPFTGITLDPVTVGTAPSTSGVTVLNPATVQMPAQLSPSLEAELSTTSPAGAAESNPMTTLLVLALVVVMGGVTLAMIVRRGGTASAAGRPRAAE